MIPIGNRNLLRNPGVVCSICRRALLQYSLDRLLVSCPDKSKPGSLGRHGIWHESPLPNSSQFCRDHAHIPFVDVRSPASPPAYCGKNAAYRTAPAIARGQSTSSPTTAKRATILLISGGIFMALMSYPSSRGRDRYRLKTGPWTL